MFIDYFLSPFIELQLSVLLFGFNKIILLTVVVVVVVVMLKTIIILNINDSYIIIFEDPVSFVAHS